MASSHYSRTYHRFPLRYPVIYGGAPFVGEGILNNLSLMGCSILSDREVLCGKLSSLLFLCPSAEEAPAAAAGVGLRGTSFLKGG